MQIARALSALLIGGRCVRVERESGAFPRQTGDIVNLMLNMAGEKLSSEVERKEGRVGCPRG